MSASPAATARTEEMAVIHRIFRHGFPMTADLVRRIRRATPNAQNLSPRTSTSSWTASSTTTPVGGEPPRRQHLLVVVNDLDRDRQLVGIDPDNDLLHATSSRISSEGIGRRGGHCCYEPGTPLTLEPRPTTAPDGDANRNRATPKRVAAARRASRRTPGPSLA